MTKFLVIVQTAITVNFAQHNGFNKALYAARAMADAYTVERDYMNRYHVSGLNSDQAFDFVSWVVIGTEFAWIKDILGPRNRQSYPV